MYVGGRLATLRAGRARRRTPERARGASNRCRIIVEASGKKVEGWCVRPAKKAASKGPVVITERGKPAHVLLSYAQYRRLRGDEPTIVDLLGMPEAEKIDFDPPKLDLRLNQVDFV